MRALDHVVSCSTYMHAQDVRQKTVKDQSGFKPRCSGWSATNLHRGHALWLTAFFPTCWNPQRCSGSCYLCLASPCSRSCPSTPPWFCLSRSLLCLVLDHSCGLALSCRQKEARRHLQHSLITVSAASYLSHTKMFLPFDCRATALRVGPCLLLYFLWW